MKAINRFLLDHNIRIARNPCISPDFCLDWEALRQDLESGQELRMHGDGGLEIAVGQLHLVENDHGDCAWILTPKRGAEPPSGLSDGISLKEGLHAWPASFENLLEIKNLLLEHDPESTVFPGTGGNLGKSTLGIGARFTTLHWPAVEWAMAALGLGVTANQNSIPRELVFDVDVMLAGKLDTVPFPFIGAAVPEGHQGQSVEGMSHGSILSKIKTGFHLRRIPWSFNADHQPIGGKYDVREDQLVTGSILASYITFDLSPELSQTRPQESPEAAAEFVRSNVPGPLVDQVRQRVGTCGLSLDDEEFNRLLAFVWPAMEKMKRRDEKYRKIRERHFRTDIGRKYLRELSIDELPGLTTPETTAVMLALCDAMEMPVQFIAPAFGFQKNSPYPDNAELETLIGRQWEVCRQFGVSIGFHSGSGKSAENYRVMGRVTGGNLEIKTSGRYTYEMGVALSRSPDAGDRKLWEDWYRFTLEMALAGAFSDDETEREMARVFIDTALDAAGRSTGVYGSPAECRAALEALPPSPDHMFWFEYNFLYVLAAGGRAEKSALGDHGPDGCRQRERFYSISPAGRLLYSKGVAAYILFLAETTGLASPERCEEARKRLEGYATMQEFLPDIGQ